MVSSQKGLEQRLTHGKHYRNVHQMHTPTPGEVSWPALFSPMAEQGTLRWRGQAWEFALLACTVGFLPRASDPEAGDNTVILVGWWCASASWVLEMVWGLWNNFPIYIPDVPCI